MGNILNKVNIGNIFTHVPHDMNSLTFDRSFQLTQSAKCDTRLNPGQDIHHNTYGGLNLYPGKDIQNCLWSP